MLVIGCGTFCPIRMGSTHKTNRAKVPVIFIFEVAALANACGVGGGAFFVPMFNVLLGFSVLINAVMPNWLITLLLVAVLTWLTVKTFMKGWQLHQSEVTAQHNEENAQVAAEANRQASSLDVKPAAPEEVHQNGLHIEDVPTDTYNTVTSLDAVHAMLESSTHLDTESGQLTPDDEDIDYRGDGDVLHQQPAHLGLFIPWRVIQFAELTCLWAAFLGLQYGKITFERCSWQYGTLCAAQAVFSVITTIGAIFQAHSLRSTAQTDLESPLLSEQKPIVSHHSWPMSQLVKCVVIVLLGGMVAGMLGFGGGMILGPLMLEMGIHPLVSSATSSVMVLFSASAATFSFAVADKLNYQYAFVYGGLCAVASIFGVAIISTSVRRSGKGSRIVFTLALIIATGALMQAVFGGTEAVHDIRTGHHISFQPLC
ncbi:MAG: hypothetical protein FRX49_01955 [Trebouxia sp. A1-2]|nr:MAG: hypothetical protein FRX49_01955 [Trebouxia sp. A1-2]